MSSQYKGVLICNSKFNIESSLFFVIRSEITQKSLWLTNEIYRIVKINWISFRIIIGLSQKSSHSQKNFYKFPLDVEKNYWGRKQKKNHGPSPVDWFTLTSQLQSTKKKGNKMQTKPLRFSQLTLIILVIVNSILMLECVLFVPYSGAMAAKRFAIGNLAIERYLNAQITLLIKMVSISIC